MKKIMLVTAVALALSACSMRSANQPLEVWKGYDSEQISAASLKEGQALAVFYRLNDVTGPATNIYINGDYQASLQSNSYSSAPVCAKNSLFSSSFVTNKQEGNRKQGPKYSLDANRIAYIKVIAGKNGQPELVKVDRAVAEKDVAQLKKVAHTLQRTKPNCAPGDVVLDKVSLSAGALFAINKSGYKDISAAGRKEIEDFATKLNAIDASKVSRVVVSGYTDPDGSKAYNQRLSQRRADSVKLALQKSNVKTKIDAIGFGAQDFVVDNCHSIKNKAERSACNQPNRRVEITIYGK